MAKPKPKTGGNLTVEPPGKKEWAVATDEAGLNAQAEKLKAKIKAKGGKDNAQNAYKRLEEVRAARGALATDPGAAGEAPVDPYQQVGDNSNDYLNNLFGQLQGQGAFNPGDYTADRQKASDNVMADFERNMGPQQQREMERFQQQMAAQGVPENSEKYRYMQGQLRQQQDSQRQNAMSQAFSAGQGEQQQAYNQASQTYQMPLTQLQSVTPFYGYNTQQNMQGNQNQWQGGQNLAQQKLDWKIANTGFKTQKDVAGMNNAAQLQAAAMAAANRGGGGLSFDQQLQLQDREFWNRQAAQMGQLQGGGSGSTGNAAAQGFAQGVGSAIGSSLK